MYRVPTNLNQGQNQTALGNSNVNLTTTCDYFEQTIFFVPVSQMAQSSYFTCSYNVLAMQQLPTPENLKFTEMAQLDEILNKYNLRDQLYILHRLPEITQKNLAKHITDKIEGMNCLIQLKTSLSLKDLIILSSQSLFPPSMQQYAIWFEDAFNKLLLNFGLKFKALQKLNDKTINKLEQIFFEHCEEFGRQFISTEITHIYAKLNFQFELHDNFYAIIHHIAICTNFVELAREFAFPNIRYIVLGEFLQLLRNSYPALFRYANRIITYKTLREICAQIQLIPGFFDLLQEETTQKTLKRPKVVDPIMEEFSYYFAPKTTLENQIISIISLSQICQNNMCHNIIEKYQSKTSTQEAFESLSLEDIIIVFRQLSLDDISALFSIEKEYIIQQLKLLKITLDDISTLDERFISKMKSISARLDMDLISCLKLPIGYYQSNFNPFNIAENFYKIFELILKFPKLKMVCNKLNINPGKLSENHYREFLKEVEKHFPDSTSTLISFSYEDIRNLCCQLAQQHELFTDSTPLISTSSYTFLGNHSQSQSSKLPRDPEEQESNKRVRENDFLAEILNEDEAFEKYLTELANSEDIDNTFTDCPAI